MERAAALHKRNLTVINVIHGACQPDLTLVDHAPQNRAAFTNAIDGQHNVFIGYGLDKFIILRRSVGFKPGNGRHRRFDV